MNIYQRIDAITDELGTVAKNLTVQASKTSSYKAVGERDIIDAVKPLEHKYGVVSFPVSREILDDEILQTENEYQGKVTKKTTFYIKIRTRYRFVNIEKPDEYIETETISDGIDSGDKGGGKAMTYGDKYALMKVYKISTGEDPDQKASEETEYKQPLKEYASEAAIKTIKIMAEKAQQPLDKICKKPIDELTADEATQIILWLKNKLGE